MSSSATLFYSADVSSLAAHEDATALPETRYEKVASVVIELGQRFYPSEVAFPIDLLSDMLVNYSFDQSGSQSIPLAWATKTMLVAHAPPSQLLDVLLSLLETRVSLYIIDEKKFLLIMPLFFSARALSV